MKILRFLFLVIAVFTIEPSYSQGYNNLWLMGYGNYAPLPFGGTNIDFYTGTANAYFEPNRTMEFSATVVNITDSLGQILFYSNGAWIANKNNVQMVNGDSLNPSWNTTNDYVYGLNLVNSHIALRLPGSDSLFILIHETLDHYFPSWADKCYYSVINMNVDNGNGEVVQKNTVFINDTLTYCPEILL